MTRSGYRVSRAAQADLRKIGRYTQDTWGKTQRRKYLNELDSRFEFIAGNPLLSRERGEFTPPVRILPHERHLIVYHTDEKSVLILRVLHAAMDVDEHLTSDD